jgi:beta-lactamase regulating signal transducer with metallopeptidase domain
MIASWMIYASVVSLVLAIAAVLLDHAAAAAVRQRRWIWVAAMLLAVAIPAWTTLSQRAAPGMPAADGRGAGTAEASRASGFGAADVLAELIARAEPRSLGRLDTLLTVVWVGSALLGLGVYALGTLSIARRRRWWREAAIDGQPVLLTAATGPAVVGALKPAIVVPEWSLGLAAEQRALMLEHERQHVAARDPLVLHGAAAAVIVMPWNLAAWWMMRRLRLAVELDCDARVLAAGRDARAYANLLLDVCARRVRTGAILSPALFERTSSLTQRILAMHPSRSRFAATRLALGAAVAVGLGFVACDVPSPEAIAPDGKNQASTRLYGDIRTVTAPGREDEHAIVARYFPSVARGEGGPSILFVARSATGEVVFTEARPASELARVGPQMGRSPAGTIRQRAIADSARGESQVGGRQRDLRSSTTPTLATMAPQPVLTRRPTRVPGGAASGIAMLRPDDIASVDVSKHAAGTIAPNAVSVITIRLKPGAVVPLLGKP